MASINTSSTSLPVSACDTAASAVQVSILQTAMQANEQMMATLMEALPVPVHDGRTGGSVDAYA